jgi:hypothetical protein
MSPHFWKALRPLKNRRPLLLVMKAISTSPEAESTISPSIETFPTFNRGTNSPTPGATAWVAMAVVPATAALVLPPLGSKVGDGEAQRLDAGAGLACEVVVPGLEFVPDGFGEVVFELRLVCRVNVPLLDFRDEEDLDRVHNERVGPFQDIWVFEVDQPIGVSGIGLELRVGIVAEET